MLFELVAGTKKLEMTQSMKLHIIHVSGRQMIPQGADRLSCGNFIEGVMSGQIFLSLSLSVSVQHCNLPSSCHGYKSEQERRGESKLNPFP